MVGPESVVNLGNGRVQVKIGWLIHRHILRAEAGERRAKPAKSFDARALASKG
jgi:hypothetical protein